MRTIKELIIHCSATPEGRDVTVADIDRYHRSLGWAGIGYHLVVYRDGSIHYGRPIEKPGAHCSGHNAHSIGVCYIGGVDAQGNPKDTRTHAQRATLRHILSFYRERFPGIAVHGHNEFAPKACPCFNVKEEYC